MYGIVTHIRFLICSVRPRRVLQQKDFSMPVAYMRFLLLGATLGLLAGCDLVEPPPQAPAAKAPVAAAPVAKPATAKTKAAATAPAPIKKKPPVVIDFDDGGSGGGGWS
jgi:hypothetical protein